ncbi:Arylsulfatase [Symmachiella macrocystis]|uniref:Arylsulfatase n=2 Tax=Symmachiella macrocystis TaxID=2527985 RepID=A0A5C6BJA0_9PLAN|nr:arylsulfatase [Symmachiella macrocystis]TWU12135.1 Arylsulfatase [Symmachiella macrocystis]
MNLVFHTGVGNVLDLERNRRTLRLVPLMCCVLCLTFSRAAQAQNGDGSVLPFPPTQMNQSVAKPRLQDSTMKWPQDPQRLPADSPNILIVLIDDVGFGISETFGGEVHTPTMTKLANEGIRYNAFHTTSICSPTRASLLTGRNHTRVGTGTIAERAIAFDGYTGVIPKTAATIAEVLKNYGYHTSAFGKWHNTPATETTAIGPKDRWPNGYGFEHFYGFLAGETSQYEPRLVENYDAVEPPHDDPTYHLTQDMVQKSLAWIDEHQAYAPDKPFLMYWAPGAVHGPHHIFPEWADKYKGKFDDGWDAYRERVHKRQLEMGIIPPGTQLTPRPETMQAWADIPPDQLAFQRRGMELFAGFAEHTDAQVGKLITGLEERGLRENTLIIFIYGDNGSSSEGQQGSISELLAQNNIPNTVEQQLAALETLGGLEVLGSSKTDNMYHAGWAWAGSTPFQATKLVASHFGGTRNPMIISWPKGIPPDKTIRNQFSHVIDVAPTLYEILGITPPKVVNGQKQIPIDGTSFAYTFTDAQAKPRKNVQFFDNNGSRAIYKDGWIACAFGPFIPWNTPASVPRVAKWDSATDEWELYNVTQDFSQANNLAQSMPEKLAELKKEFLLLANDNKDFPIGAGNWLRLHPEDRITTPYTSWTFNANTRRMPEFTAPGLGRESNTVEIDLDIPKNASGVLYALGGSGGGLTLYMDQGRLVYLYNMLIIEQYTARSAEPIPAGQHKIKVVTDITGPGQSGTVTFFVDKKQVGQVELKRTVPVAFSASESFDVGADLGSTVSLDYFDRRPFEFNGSIQSVKVNLKKR